MIANQETKKRYSIGCFVGHTNTINGEWSNFKPVINEAINLLNTGHFSGEYICTHFDDFKAFQERISSFDLMIIHGAHPLSSSEMIDRSPMKDYLKFVNSIDQFD